MLSCFRIPDHIAVRVSSGAMRSTLQNLFMALGMARTDAVQASEVLIYADVRGIDSHGASNMTRAYVAGLKAGRINATPSWRGGGPFRRGDSAHYFMAFHVEQFSDLASFRADMDRYLRRLLDCRPAPGQTRVIYPGVEAEETAADRIANGIPYHPEVIHWFKTTCQSLGADHQL